MQDAQLVEVIIAGNIQAYGELMRRYEAPLLRYVNYLIHDQHAAEDVVQETFIKAYRNLKQFNRRRKFSSWLYRIAHNAAMDTVRKRRPIAMDEDSLGQIATVHSTIADKIDRSILARDIIHCLSELDIKYREPVILHYFQRRNYSDISDILRIPKSTVGVRISRAKQKLFKICRQLEVQYEG